MELTPVLKDALQEQMNIERANEAWYRQCGLMFKAENWDGFAHFMKHSGREERHHSYMFAHHLIDRNVTPEYEEVSVPDVKGGILVRFQQALELERANTSRINSLYEKAIAGKDYQMAKFLHWLIDEQTKSERDLVDITLLLSRAGTDEAALNQIDKKLK